MRLPLPSPHPPSASPPHASSTHWLRALLHDLVPGLGLAFAAILLGLLLSQWASLGVQFDGLLYDTGLTSQPKRHTDEVILVGLSENFMNRKQAALMPRDRLAKLIRILAAGRPSVIVLDVWLDSYIDGDENNARSRDGRSQGVDAHLRQTLLEVQRAGVPVLLAQVSTANMAGRDEGTVFGRQAAKLGKETGVTAHSTTLAYFAKAATGVGNVDALPDKDGIFRTIPPSIPGSHSLPLQAAILHAKSHGTPLDTALITRLENELTPINFLGGPDAINITNADTLLTTDYIAKLWGGKAIFVGATYERSLDLVRTPYSLNSAKSPRFIYGVEVLAQSTVTILEGAPRLPSHTSKALLPIVLWTFLLSLVVASLALHGVLWGVGAFLGAVSLACYVSIISAQAPTAILGNHFWPASPLLFSALLACVGGIGYRQMRSSRELRELTTIFQGHVGKQVLDQIKVKRPELGGEMRDIAILFCDIRGFSSISEQLRDDPVRLLALLNEHFEPLVNALERREAYTDNYVGDLVMGVFGAPFSHSFSNDTRHAVLAGVDFVRIMRERAKRQKERGEAVIEAGVGIHCGPAVVGYLGTREHMHYTAVGDTVNIASRIESSTRDYNEPLLVTEDVVQVCGDCEELPAEGWEFVAQTQLKGRETPVKLYRRRDLDALVAASASDNIS